MDELDSVTHRGKAHLAYPGQQKTLCGKWPPDGMLQWFYRTRWGGVINQYLCKQCLEKAKATPNEERINE
jgi:hypothetical protein